MISFDPHLGFPSGDFLCSIVLVILHRLASVLDEAQRNPGLRSYDLLSAHSWTLSAASRRVDFASK